MNAATIQPGTRGVVSFRGKTTACEVTRIVNRGRIEIRDASGGTVQATCRKGIYKIGPCVVSFPATMH